MGKLLELRIPSLPSGGRAVYGAQWVVSAWLLRPHRAHAPWRVMKLMRQPGAQRASAGGTLAARARRSTSSGGSSATRRGLCTTGTPARAKA